MSLELLIEQRRQDLGGGFMVGRVLPFRKRRMVGPFIFWDHLGPVDLPAGLPKAMDVLPHPHIGLSTLTYLYAGALTHRDSLGFTQEITPGAVNWMTAGSGITHSERLEYARARGCRMHGIQAWVALPDDKENIAPSFKHYPAASLPNWHSLGVQGRIIAGTWAGLTAPTAIHSPMFLVHLEMQPRATYNLPPEYSERAIYISSGTIQLNGHQLSAGQMAVLTLNLTQDFTALTPATVMLLGGEPVGPRFIWWNFVASNQELLQAASHDWQAGRLTLPFGDDQEWIELPEAWR